MKNSYIAALIVIGMLVAYIAATSSSYSSYETFATAYTNTGKNFQVVGTLVADKPLYYEPEKDANYFSFYMLDANQEERQVVYHGTKPQDFERSEQIVITGNMQGESFVADKILLKCPSKYNDELEDKLNEDGYYEVESQTSK